jgi:hypothetical protein
MPVPNHARSINPDRPQRPEHQVAVQQMSFAQQLLGTKFEEEVSYDIGLSEPAGTAKAADVPLVSGQSITRVQTSSRAKAGERNLCYAGRH